MYDPKIKVLIVDDMLTMRKIITRAFKLIGFENLVEASDGQKAWEILGGSDHSIDLIVSDWNMPNCTGFDLLKRVRGDGRFKALPFLLLTAESDGNQVSVAVKAGVDNYIIKPFTPEILKEKLAEAYVKSSKRVNSF